MALISKIKTYFTGAADYLRHTQYIVLILSRGDYAHTKFADLNPRTARSIYNLVKVQEFIQDQFRYRIVDNWNNFRHRWFNPPRKFKVDTIKSLDWYDIDERMFHTMFQYLSDFVELELPQEARAIGYTPAEHCLRGKRYPGIAVGFMNMYYGKSEREEIKFLYLWWINFRNDHMKHGRRPIVSSKLFRKISSFSSDPMAAVHISADSYDFRTKIEDEMLRRLLSIRHQLWT